MEKKPLRRFDVTDYSGQSIPVLGRAANGLLAAATLAALVWRLPGRNYSTQNLRSIWPRLLKIAAWSPKGANLEAAALIEELSVSKTAAGIIRDLSDNFLLIAMIPGDKPAARQVFKYSYHWEMKIEKVNAIKAGFALEDYELQVGLGSIHTARSYHFECQAPAGLHSCDHGTKLPHFCKSATPWRNKMLLSKLHNLPAWVPGDGGTNLL